MLNTLRTPVGNMRMKTAFGSAFYTLFNPQIRIIPVAPIRFWELIGPAVNPLNLTLT